MLRASAFVSLLVLAACAPAHGGSSDGGQTAQPDPAWWGLVDNSCRHYQDAGGNQNYALEIRKDANKIPGVVTWHVTDKLNGFAQVERWFEVTKDSLLLRAQTSYEGNAPTVYTTYSPPPVFLQNDLDEGASVESDTTAHVSGGTSGDAAAHFSLAVLGPDTLTIGGAGVDATKLTLSVQQDGVSDTVERFWLAPKYGIAKLDPPGATLGEETFVSAEPIPSDGCL